MNYEVLTVPHRARAGESLLDVAARYTGSPGRWLELAAVNRGPLRSSSLAGVEAEAPLPAGLFLQLPAAWAPRLPRRRLESALGAPAADWLPLVLRLANRGLQVPGEAMVKVQANMKARLPSLPAADDLAFVAAYWWAIRFCQKWVAGGKGPLPAASSTFWGATSSPGGGGFPAAAGFLPTPEESDVFAKSALSWGTLHGAAMKPGEVRQIPWEEVPWAAVNWQGTNFLAFDWAPVASLWAQRSNAAFGPDAHKPPLPNLPFVSTDWAGNVWGSTEKWSAVRWSSIPWGSVPWLLVERAPAVFAEASQSAFERTYTGSQKRYDGTLVSPTTYLLLKLFEKYPALTLTSLLPPPRVVTGGSDPAAAQEGGPPGGRPPSAIRKNADGSSEVTKEIEDWWERQKKTDLPPVKVEVSGVSTLTLLLGAAAAGLALYFALSPKSRRRLPPCPRPPRSSAPDKPRPRSAPGGTRPSRLASTSTRTSTRRRPPPPTRPTRWRSSPRRSRSLPAPSSRRTPPPSSR